VSPLGSVPVRIDGASGNGPRDCAMAADADTSSTHNATIPRARAPRYAGAMRLRIRRLDSTIPLPAYGTGESAGFDLAAAQDVSIPPHGIALVGTGLVIEVPTGYFLGIFARSSTPLKRGLLVANGVGVIDPDYSGPTDEIKIQLLNISGNAVQVSRGDRLAQGIVLPAPRVTWDEVTELRSAVRGGFGSTG